MSLYSYGCVKCLCGKWDRGQGTGSTTRVWQIVPEVRFGIFGIIVVSPLKWHVKEHLLILIYIHIYNMSMLSNTHKHTCI